MKKTDLYLKPGTYIKSSTTQGDVQGISLENFVVSVLNNPTCCAKPVFIKNGMLMTTNYLSGSLQSVLDQGSNTSPLQLSTQLVRIDSTLEVAERLNIESDSTVTTQISSVIQATTVGANLVIAPNATGALVANIPDGTIVGGNARGSNTVDLQMARTSPNQVAIGNRSGILSGNGNRVSSDESVIAGGLLNLIQNGNSFIGGGQSNTIQSNYSTISGGQSNTASTNTHATVVGGQSNTSSGQHSVSGGFGNTASGAKSISLGGTGSNTATANRAIVLGGEGNTANNSNSCVINSMYSTASGPYSVVINGASGNQASGTYSMVINLGQAIANNSIAFNNGNASSVLGISFNTQARSTLHNQFSISNGVNVNGGSQSSQLIASNSAALTTGGTLVLSLDGTSTTNLIIPNIDFTGATSRAWNVQIDTIAVVTAITGTATGVSVGDVYSEVKNLLFKRIGGTSSIVGTVDTTSIKSNTSMATASLTVTAGASQEMALTFASPSFSGGGSLTIRVVSKLSLVEVAY